MDNKDNNLRVNSTKNQVRISDAIEAARREFADEYNSLVERTGMQVQPLVRPAIRPDGTIVITAELVVVPVVGEG